MPNIKISDLPDVTLPLDAPNVFLEVQATEAGEDVSRRVSAQLLQTAIGLDASFVTVGLNAALPNERVLTGGTGITLVDGGAGSTLTIDAVVPPAGNLPVGTVEGAHLRWDDTGGDWDENPEFLWDDTLKTLTLVSDAVTQPIFGVENIGGDGIISTDWRTEFNPRIDLGSNKIGGASEIFVNSQMHFFAAASIIFRIHAGPLSTSPALALDHNTVRAQIFTGPAQGHIEMFANNGDDDIRFLFDTGLQIQEKAAAHASIAALGQFWVRDDVPNVAMFTDDAGDDFVLNAAGSPSIDTFNYLFDDAINLADPGVGSFNLNNATLASVTAMAISKTDADGNDLTEDLLRVNRGTVFTFRDAADPTIFGRFSRVGTKTDAGTFWIFSLFLVDSDTLPLNNAELPFQINYTPFIESFDFGSITGAIPVWNLAEGRFDVDDNNWRLTTGGGISQLGTNQNLRLQSAFRVEINQPFYIGEQAADGGAVAAFGQVWVRDDVPNVLMFTDDTGVDFQLSGFANVVAGSVEGHMVGWDVGNTRYEVVAGVTAPSSASPPAVDSGYLVFGTTSSVDERRPQMQWSALNTTSVHYFAQAEVGPDGFYLRTTGADNPPLHAWGYSDAGADTNIFQIDAFDRFTMLQAFYITERAAANGPIATLGEFWVRSDTPNTPMFTDDGGSDFELNAAAIGAITLVIRADINTATPPTTEAVTCELSLQDLDGTDVLGEFGFTNGNNDLFIRNLMHGGEVFITREDAGGVLRTPFEAAASTIVRSTGNLSLIVNNTEQALLAIANGATELFQNNVGTIRTVVAASGGAQVNNLSTGAGYERVLTTADLGGGVGISGTPVNNQIAIWVNATDIEGDPDLTFAASVLTMTNASGVLTITRGITDVTISNLAAGGDIFYNTLADHVFQIAGVTLFEIDNGGARFLFNNFGLFLEERSTAGPDLATYGQLWIDNTTPQRFTFTDEAGVDKIIMNLFDAQQVDGFQDFRGQNLQQAGFLRFTDNINLEFGTGIDVQIDWNGTNFTTAGPAASVWLVTGFDQLRIDMTLGMNEQAAPDGNVAGVGQWWVRSAAPARPMFTDDTDIDQEMDPSRSDLNTQNGNYTLLITDKGQTIYKASGGAGETITIPSNASVGYQIGTWVAFDNDGGGDLTIAITSDVLVGTDGVTGSRTLGDNHRALIQKIGATRWRYQASDL